MRLGELLVREGKLSPEQVQAALRRQIIHGGRLGSNLVELGFLAMEDLALALGRHHELPAALQQHFNHIDPTLIAKLSPDLAASWHAVPLGRAGPEERYIAVATTDPFGPDVLYELQRVFEADIIQAISPELRLLYWLEQIYGIERTNRYKRSARSEASDASDENTEPERRAYIRTLSDADSVGEISPLARVAVKRMAVPLSGELELPIDPHNLEDCCRAIRQATSRARMGDIVTDVLENGFEGAFAAGMLLTIRDELAIGWRGFVRDQPDKAVEVLAVPLCTPSIFVQPSESGTAFFGSPDSPSIVDERLWQFLGATPTEFAVVPIEVMDGITGLLYVQCSQSIPAEHAGALGDLTRALAAGLTRLIRAASR